MEQMDVSIDQLLQEIGRLTVENRILRSRLDVLRASLQAQARGESGGE